MRTDEIKAMDTADIIISIYYLGIVMSDERGTKSEERTLQHLFKELEKRGVIQDGAKAYEKTTK